MGSVAELARDSGVAVQRVGSLELVSADDAGFFLDAVERSAIRVLGAECFRLSGGEVFPDMDAILDVSDVTDAYESIREARSFVERVATSDMLFEFVVDDQAPAT